MSMEKKEHNIHREANCKALFYFNNTKIKITYTHNLGHSLDIYVYMVH